MNKAITTLLICAGLFSCKKINPECKIFFGQFEWSHSISDHAEFGTMDKTKTQDKYALVVKEQKILFYKNGKTLRKTLIKSSQCSSNKLEIVGKDGTILFIYLNKTVTTGQFPFYGSSNYLYKTE